MYTRQPKFTPVQKRRIEVAMLSSLENGAILNPKGMTKFFKDAHTIFQVEAKTNKQYRLVYNQSFEDYGISKQEMSSIKPLEFTPSMVNRFLNAKRRLHLRSLNLRNRPKKTIRKFQIYIKITEDTLSTQSTDDEDDTRVEVTKIIKKKICKRPISAAIQTPKQRLISNFFPKILKDKMQ